MAKTTIEWCHYTFNPWWGCSKVSAGCRHCYAEALARRLGKAKWGPGATRVLASAQSWRAPRRWQKQAIKRKRRTRVFCASMADVFEPLAELGEPRERLWALIEDTEHLDWLLLTKRPEQVMALIPAHWRHGLPPNVGLGVTLEDRASLGRLDVLCTIPCGLRFASCEPLLGPLDLHLLDATSHQPGPAGYVRLGCDVLDWVIVGGESGPGARPMHPDWVRSLRDQCAEARVPFFFKQWGNWRPTRDGASRAVGLGGEVVKVGDAVLRELEAGASPEGIDRYGACGDWQMIRQDGKKGSGRALDGQRHEGLARQLKLFVR